MSIAEHSASPPSAHTQFSQPSVFTEMEESRRKSHWEISKWRKYYSWYDENKLVILENILQVLIHIMKMRWVKEAK